MYTNFVTNFNFKVETLKSVMLLLPSILTLLNRMILIFYTMIHVKGVSQRRPLFDLSFVMHEDLTVL